MVGVIKQNKRGWNNMDKVWRETEDTQNVYVDRRKLMQVAWGSGRHLSLQGKGWKILNQITTGTISVDTLRCRLRRGTEHIWVCPKCKNVDSWFYSIIFFVLPYLQRTGVKVVLWPALDIIYEVRELWLYRDIPWLVPGKGGRSISLDQTCQVGRMTFPVIELCGLVVRVKVRFDWKKC
jgi:hypothetical protein